METLRGTRSTGGLRSIRGRVNADVDRRLTLSFLKAATVRGELPRPNGREGRPAALALCTKQPPKHEIGSRTWVHHEPERSLGTNRPFSARNGGHRRCAQPEPGNREGGNEYAVPLGALGGRNLEASADLDSLAAPSTGQRSIQRSALADTSRAEEQQQQEALAQPNSPDRGQRTASALQSDARRKAGTERSSPRQTA